MSAGGHTIKWWLERAKAEGATHLIVGCDPMDYDNFPVNVMPSQSVVSEYNRIIGTGNRVDEVYSLISDVPVEAQFKEHRSFHFEPEEDPCEWRRPRTSFAGGHRTPASADAGAVMDFDDDEDEPYYERDDYYE